MRHRLSAAFVAALLSLGTIQDAHGDIKLIPEFDPETRLTRPIETVEEFRAKLSVGVYEDPRLANPQRLREIIEKLDLRTPLGRKVTSVAIHPDTGALVGVDSGSIQFVGTLPEGSIIVSTRDPAGQFTKVDKNNVAWARPNGKPVCFDVLDVDKSDVKMSFTLLLDRSGSMARVMDEVLATSRHFVSELPGNAQCSVVSFAGDWTNHTPGGAQQCRAVRIGNSMRAGGSTDIYSPLSALYRRYASPAFNGWQKAVIIITDGVATSSKDTKDELKALKGNVKTFTYWLGSHDEKYLSGIADYFIARQGDMRTQLSEIYDVIGEAYSKQRVLKSRACAAGPRP